MFIYSWREQNTVLLIHVFHIEWINKLAGDNVARNFTFYRQGSSRLRTVYTQWNGDYTINPSSV